MSHFWDFSKWHFSAWYPYTYIWCLCIFSECWLMSNRWTFLTIFKNVDFRARKKALTYVETVGFILNWFIFADLYPSKKTWLVYRSLRPLLLYPFFLKIVDFIYAILTPQNNLPHLHAYFHFTLQYDKIQCKHAGQMVFFRTNFNYYKLTSLIACLVC